MCVLLEAELPQWGRLGASYNHGLIMQRMVECLQYLFIYFFHKTVIVRLSECYTYKFIQNDSVFARDKRNHSFW